MYLVLRMSSKWCAIAHDQEDQEDQERLYTFVEDGTPVVVVHALHDLAALGIEVDVDDIEIVTPD